MYTPIIAIADLKTHLYAEIIEEITRTDDTIAESAISTAVAEASVFLSRYDRTALFGSITGDTAATFSDPYLKGLVKDLAMWHLINLANVNIQYEHIRTRYEDAIASFKMIQAGKSNPAWPYQDTTDITAPDGISVKSHNSDKRNNRY